MTMNDCGAIDGTSSERLARWFSRVFHPFVMSVIALLLSIYLETGLLWEAVLWASVSLAVFLLPFSVLILVMVCAGRYSDLDVSIREQRHGLYLVGSVGLFLLVVIFTLGGAPLVSRVSIYAAVFSTAASALFNRFSKISVHAMVAAGSAAVLSYLSPLASLFLTAPTALVGWSRVRLKRHTWFQVVAGWSMAVVCVIVVFYFWL
jgi:membrane-associated phospholipid phosphatase